MGSPAARTMDALPDELLGATLSFSSARALLTRMLLSIGAPVTP